MASLPLNLLRPTRIPCLTRQIQPGALPVGILKNEVPTLTALAEEEGGLMLPSPSPAQWSEWK